jgi:hypothetical protein
LRTDCHPIVTTAFLNQHRPRRHLWLEQWD